jgi:hypothetical protein
MAGVQNVQCPQCKGKGQVKNPNGSLYQVCPYCGGDGQDPGVERFFEYKWPAFQLTALQLLPNQRIVISGDSDFRIKMLMRRKTGDFRIRLYDSSGHYYSSSGEGGTNDRVPDVCLFGDGQLPFLVVPHIMIPAGGFIAFDLEDLSNANNTIELVFGGAKVYATPTS